MPPEGYTIDKGAAGKRLALVVLAFYTKKPLLPRVAVFAFYSFRHFNRDAPIKVLEGKSNLHYIHPLFTESGQPPPFVQRPALLFKAPSQIYHIFRQMARYFPNFGSWRLDNAPPGEYTIDKGAAGKRLAQLVNGFNQKTVTVLGGGFCVLL